MAGMISKLFKRKGEEETSFEQEVKSFNKKSITTSKRVIWVLTINSILWIWCSYILAFLGKEQIAQELSSNVCTVIIGQTLGYFITKTMENISKYNDNGIFGTTNILSYRDSGAEHLYKPPVNPDLNDQDDDGLPDDPDDEDEDDEEYDEVK